MSSSHALPRSSPAGVRAVHVVCGVVANCHSSACVELGGTRVIAVVRPPQQLVQEYRGPRGRVGVVVHRTPTGGELAASDGSAERDMALALEGVAEQAVVLESIAQLLVEVVIEVLSDDGGLWGAASTAMSAALAAGGFDMFGLFSACSAALLSDGSVAVDPTAAAEKTLDATLTVCMNLGTGAILYLAHSGACEAATMQQLLHAAQDGLLARRQSILDQIRYAPSRVLLLYTANEPIMPVAEVAAVTVAAPPSPTAGAPAGAVVGASGSGVLTPELLRKICKQHGGYTTEELNEQLYLHHYGFREVGHLAPYTGVRVLYLSHNALRDLQPLAPLVSLTALYVSSNALDSLTTLPHLPHLELLDVARNRLTDLKGVAAAAPRLETLLAAHNRITAVSAEVLEPLQQLATLDLAHNALADEEKLMAALSAGTLRQTLRTLVLDGNDAPRTARHYRRRWISHFPALRALDALPVFPEERERAEAFAAGGAAAEAAAAADIRQRHDDERAAQFRYFGGVRAVPRGRRLTDGPRTTPTPYFADQLGDGDGDAVYIPSPL